MISAMLALMQKLLADFTRRFTECVTKKAFNKDFVKSKVFRSNISYERNKMDEITWDPEHLTPL